MLHFFYLYEITFMLYVRVHRTFIHSKQILKIGVVSCDYRYDETTCSRRNFRDVFYVLATLRRYASVLGAEIETGRTPRVSMWKRSRYRICIQSIQHELLPSID